MKFYFGVIRKGYMTAKGFRIQVKVHGQGYDYLIDKDLLMSWKLYGVVYKNKFLGYIKRL